VTAKLKAGLCSGSCCCTDEEVKTCKATLKVRGRCKHPLPSLRGPDVWAPQGPDDGSTRDVYTPLPTQDAP
jgi:hypothetical protein